MKKSGFNKKFFWLNVSVFLKSIDCKDIFARTET